MPVRLILLLLLVSSSAQAAPQFVKASYLVIKAGQEVGTIDEQFSVTNNKYRIDSVTQAKGVYALFAKGSIRLSSEGEVSKAGLRPLHFEHHRGDKPAKRIVADFDWKAANIAHRFDGKTETAALKPGTQDRISQQYQFMFQPPVQPNTAFYTSSGRKLSLQEYRRIGEESIKMPAGNFTTIHLSKQHAPDEDGVEIWLAKSHHYFPVRIVFKEKDGSILEQQVRSLSFTQESKTRKK
ncbi:MAG: DUF3108 domain-containing protein [Sulfuricellaceae bacterium]|nr:DUF3108 domain-containing protein [Sulfuricellaceae bacterium]